MANGELIANESISGNVFQTLRFLDEITAPVASDWMEAHLFRKGTLDVKANAGVPTCTIKVQGCNDVEKPSSSYDGATLITDIAAIGIYELAKLPVRWIRLKATAVGGTGSVSVRGHLGV